MFVVLFWTPVLQISLAFAWTSESEKPFCTKFFPALYLRGIRTGMNMYLRLAYVRFWCVEADNHR